MNTLCPECAGPHLYDLTFQHAVSCDLYRADTATTVADRQRGRGIRPATPTEIVLAAALGTTPPEGAALAVEFLHDGIHHRRITGTTTKETTP